MLKINEFCELHDITPYRLALSLGRPYNDGETLKQWRRRQDKFLRRRIGSDWEIMFSDGVVTMRSQDGGLYKYEDNCLNAFITSV